MLSNTGAYGNHGPGVLFHGSASWSRSIAAPNKKIDGYAVYTNTMPSGAFRGYGLSQTELRGRIGDGRGGAEARH